MTGETHDAIGPAPPRGLPREVFVSVDIEAAGPNPSQYSLLSIGACLVVRPEATFYAELKPTTDEFQRRALEVSGLSMQELATNGTDPEQALLDFERWLSAEVPEGDRAVFTAFNAAFDWMFVNDYFHRFLGRNPFGASALDMKAYYMGMTGVAWTETSMRFLAPRYLGGRRLVHNALADAVDQAELFRAILAEADLRKRPGESEMD